MAFVRVAQISSQSRRDVVILARVHGDLHLAEVIGVGEKAPS